MHTHIGRRTFLRSSLLCAGAGTVAVLLGNRAGQVSPSPKVDPATTARAGALRFAETHCDAVNCEQRGDVLHVTGTPRSAEAMSTALRAHRAHGIAKLHAEGNRYSFEIDGQRIHLEHVWRHG